MNDDGAINAQLELPLAGIRVLDFGTTVAGPTAARHLSDYGAEVIKIESEVHPDTLRVGAPYAEGKPGINRSGYFAVYNAGKLSFALNLRIPESHAILRMLVERSDIVIETFRPGVMDRWGIGYEQMREWNPAIIMASHSLQGQWGPRAKHRGYGQLASAVGGWYELTGMPNAPPMGPYSAYTDFIAWPFLLVAILTALEVRDVTGVGQRIDHSQVESSIHFLAPLLLDLQLTGTTYSRRGNREDYAAPNNAYPCDGDDQWIAITVLDDEQWRALCDVLERPEWSDDIRFASPSARIHHADDLDVLIAERTRGRHPQELAETLQARGVAAGVVAKAQDLFEDEQLQHRQLFRRLDHPEIGSHAVLTSTFHIDGMASGPHRAAPLLGEHTHQVCRDVLGLEEEEIARYAALGVFY
ncbi:MAG TPA: CoA transferase [Dehalococcoidia bacterium]|nr:CoA transferase [Dehalococcoidia bacterium]